MTSMRNTLVLVGLGLALLGLSQVGALEVERACEHVTKNYLTPNSCHDCCIGNGYSDFMFYASNSRCMCLVATPERKRQEAALKASSSERVCAHLSGASHEQIDGVPLEIACGQCCREHGFRTNTFNIDHHFASGVGASVRGTGASSVRSECLCEGLTLNFVQPQDGN